MDRSNSFDVAVVGGGIAGSTAAILFARQGLKVALIEAHENPEAYKALCTHFIQPSATPTIQRLGLDGDIERAGGLRNSLEVWNRWGWIRHPDAGEEAPFGYSIRRQKLDPLLRSTAAITPGVEFMPGRTATALIRDGARVAGVQVRDHNGVESAIAARLVVAADGRHSKVAELAGVGAKSIPNKRSGYFAYYEGVNLDNTTRMWFLDPDVAYAFPNDDGVTVLACMFGRRDKLDWFRRDLTGNLRRVFERLPDPPNLSEAVQVSKVLGAVDLPNTWRNKPPGGLAFVGDAMVAADPLWGVGCGWAFQSAEWLVESTAESFGRDSDLDRAVAGYRKVVRKQLLGHFLMTSEYGRGRRYNPAEKILFAAAAHDDKLARIVQAFGARTIPVSKIISPVTMGRAVMVNLRTRPAKTQVELNRSIARAAIRPPEESGAGAELRRGSIEVSGITSPFIESGPSSSAEAVVFVHGNPGSSEDYVDLVAEAGKLTRAVAFDMPGFGKADKPADFDYTVEGYATHLGRMLREVGVERAHLVLHDFGGPWGLAWAAANPQAYASATLIDTGVLEDYKWHYLAKIWQTPLLGEVFMATTNRPGFRLLLRHGNRGGLPRPFLDRMYEDFDSGTKRAIVKLYRATRNPQAAFQELGAALKKLDRPALVIWGRRDPYVGVEQAERQKLTFPDVRVVVLDESGHWPFVDNPEAVKSELMDFLASVVHSQERVSA